MKKTAKTVKTVRLNDVTQKWVNSNVENFSSYVIKLIVEDMRNSENGKAALKAHSVSADILEVIRDFAILDEASNGEACVGDELDYLSELLQISSDIYSRALKGDAGSEDMNKLNEVRKEIDKYLM